MTTPLRPSDDELMRRIVKLEQNAYATTRGLPTGRQSLGIDSLRPGIKSGIPSDADYGVVIGKPVPSIVPRVGTQVTDLAGSRLYVRMTDVTVAGGLVTALGTWKSVALT